MAVDYIHIRCGCLLAVRSIGASYSRPLIIDSSLVIDAYYNMNAIRYAVSTAMTLFCASNLASQVRSMD
jgi:hypothetical protein